MDLSLLNEAAYQPYTCYWAQQRGDVISFNVWEDKYLLALSDLRTDYYKL